MGKTETKVSGAKSQGDHTPQPAVSEDWDAWLATPVKTKKKKRKLYHSTVKHSNKELRSARPNLEDMPLEDRPLTERQEKFCQYFIETGNGRQSAIKAGYSEASAEAIASETLRRPNVAKRIKYLRDKAMKPHIATSSEVMQFFSDVMNGKIKDQFGLEASLSDRTKAAVELAKRTVDLDQKLAGKPDATIEIKLDWKRSEGES